MRSLHAAKESEKREKSHMKHEIHETFLRFFHTPDNFSHSKLSGKFMKKSKASVRFHNNAIVRLRGFVAFDEPTLGYLLLWYFKLKSKTKINAS